MSLLFFFFFFKQKTAYEMRISDWSSDVCSSDLDLVPGEEAVFDAVHARVQRGPDRPLAHAVGGHLEPGAVRLVDDGAQFLVGVLLGAGRAGVRQDRKSVV